MDVSTKSIFIVRSPFSPQLNYELPSLKTNHEIECFPGNTGGEESNTSIGLAPGTYLVFGSDHGNMTIVMKTEIAAGEFKAKCLGLLDEVQKHRSEIVITKRGKPVAKLVPLEEPQSKIFGRMKGSVTILGDIISPIDVEWDAERDHDDPDDSAGYSLLDLDSGRNKK